MTKDKKLSIIFFLTKSLMWIDSIPKPIQLILFWISGLHTLFILLYLQLEFIAPGHDDTFTIFLRKISRILVCKDVFTSKNNSQMINIIYFAAWTYSFLVLSLVLFLLVKFAFKQQISRPGRYIIFLIGQFHLAIGFWFVNTFLLSSISISDPIKTIVGNYPSENKGIHALHTILVVLHYIFGLLVAVFSFDPFHSSNILATHSPIHQVITFLCKAFILPAIAVPNMSEGILWYCVICCLFFSLIKYGALRLESPYYDYKAIKMSLGLGATFIVFAFTNLIGNIVQKSHDISATSIVYIEIFMAMLLIKLAHIRLEQIVIKYASIPEKKLRTQNDVLKKIFAINTLLCHKKVLLNSHKNQNLYELQFQGMSDSILEMKDVSLDKNTTNGKENVLNDEEIANRIIFQLLSNSIQRIRNANLLKILLAHHMLKQDINLPVTMIYLLEVTKVLNRKQFIALKLLDDLEKKVQRAYESKEAALLDIKTFTDLDIQSTRFINMIQNTTKKFIKFWETYCSPIVELRILFNLSQEIEKEDNKIQKFWSQKMKNYGQRASCIIHIFTYYLSVVKNLPATALKLRKNFHKLNLYEEKSNYAGKILTDISLYDPSNMTVHATLDHNGMGKIIYASQNIEDQLGWNQKDLLGKSINNLMISSMRDKHSKILSKFVQEGAQVGAINKNLETFALTKEGYVVPITLYIALFPYIQNQLVYIAVIRAQKPLAQKIVINEKGLVEGITSEIAHKLKISPKDQIPINKFCLNSDELGLFGRIEQPKQYKKYMSIQTVQEFDFNNNNETKPTRKWMSTEKRQIILQLCALERCSKYIQFQPKDYPATLTYLPFGDTFFYVLTFYNKNENNYAYEDEELDFEDYRESLIKYSEDNEDEDNPIPSEKFTNEVLTLNSGLMTTNRNLLNTGRISQKAIITSTLQKNKTDADSEKGDKRKLSQKHHEDISKEFSIGSIDVDKKRIKAMALRDNDQSSTRSQSFGDFHSNTENALRAVPSESYGKVLTLFSMIFSWLSGALLIRFQYENTDTIRDVASHTLIASNWSRELGYLVQLNEWAMRYELMDKNIYNELRYIWLGVPVLSQGTPSLINETLSALIPINTALRNAIFNINDKFQDRFYEDLPMYNRDDSNNISYINASAFSIVDQVISSALRLFNRSSAGRIPGSNEDILFIKDNTLNEILIFGENIVDVVLDDNEQKLQRSSNLYVVFTCISAAMSGLLIMFFLLLIIRFIQKRNKMLSVFLRINEVDIKAHLLIVEQWSKLLEKNKSSSNFDALSLLDPSIEQITHIKELHMFRKKPTNKEHINKKLITLIILGISLTIGLFIGFPIAMPLLSKQNEEARKKIDLVLNCDRNQYQSLLLLYEINIYVAQGGQGRVRGLPLSEELDRLYASVVKLFGEFVTLTIQMADYSNDPIVHEILTGNLCEIFPSRYKIGVQYCPIGLKGAISNGLIQVASYILNKIRETKITFDKSPKGFGDIMAALNIFYFLEIEPMASDYWFPAFGKMSDVIRDQFISESTALNHPSGKFILAWGIIFIIIGFLGWWRIQVSFEKHRVAWMGLVRQIPISIVTTNKMLKSYLSATSNSKIN